MKIQCADLTARFSAYIFGRATKNENVFKVGYVIEQVTAVRSELKPYLEPETEIEHVIAP